MATEKKVNAYEMVFYGVFGRNRKAKSQTVMLVERDPEVTQPTIGELTALVTGKLEALKAKSGKYKVVKTEHTVTDYGDGLVSRSFMCFSGQTVLGPVEVP